MASLGQVLSVLTQNAANAVYPNGLMQPSTAGVDTTIISGWPIRNKIDEVLSAGKALISVFPTSKVKIVTKFERVYQEITVNTPTLTATVLNNTITIGGTVSTPLSVMAIVNNIGYSYQVQTGDTLNSIATNLALLIPGATAVANVITITGVYSLDAKVITTGTAAYELSRQERVFLVRCWATSPTIRDNLMNPIDIAFKVNYRIVLPDGFYGIVFPMESPQPFLDDWEKQLMIIGNLEYKVQYATTVTEDFYTIGDTIENLEVVNKIT